jgi:hypothetical protein
MPRWPPLIPPPASSAPPPCPWQLSGPERRRQSISWLS